MLRLNVTDNSQNYSDLHATTTPVEVDVAGRLMYILRRFAHNKL